MRSQRGFSLVELLFALLVLTLVITTSLYVFAERARRMQLASETILAYQALANESEVRRHYDYNDPRLADNDFQSDTVVIRPLQPFTTKVKVTIEKPGVKKILMTVTWRNREAQLAILRVDTGGTNLW